MRVFISWSGEPSRSIAQALRDWLPMVVQHVEPWMSDADVESGGRWNEAVARALDASDFGVVCVTRANQSAPWLIFEAGALAKTVAKAAVVPLCIDLPPSDLTGPLATFQGRFLDEDGVRRLVHDLSRDGEWKISTEGLNKLFNAMWPQVREAIDEALEGHGMLHESQRPVPDMVAEVVEIVRRIERTMDVSAFAGGSEEVPPYVFRALPLDEMERLAGGARLKSQIIGSSARQQLRE
jgi:hypothetical protein